jgi:phytoene dehydrogenase-like protein
VVPGLYCVGHWTRPGGGITPVIVSAQQVARRVLLGAPAAVPASVPETIMTRKEG